MKPPGKSIYIAAILLTLIGIATAGSISQNSQDEFRNGTLQHLDPDSVPGTLRLGIEDQSDPSLIGFWRFEETDGDVIDYSGNGHTGTAQGGVTRGVDGVRGTNAFSLDGSDDYIAIDNLFYDRQGQINDISVCSWAKSTNTDGENQMIASFDRSEYWSLKLDNGGPDAITWSTTNGSEDTNDITSSSSYIDGSWHYICGTFSRGGGSDYVNGTVNYYDLDEGSGTTVNDRVGNADGKLNPTSTGPTWRSSGCHEGNCLEGNDGDDWVNLTKGDEPTQAITVSFWGYLDATEPGYQTFVDGDFSDRYYTGVTDEDHTGGEWQLSTNPNGRSKIAAGNYSTGTWHHGAFTYNASTGNWSKYIDGQLVNWSLKNGPIYESDEGGCLMASECAGISGAQYDNSLDGRLDNVCIMDRDLTKGQINDVFNNGCYQPIDEAEKNIFVDGSQVNSTTLERYGALGTGTTRYGFIGTPSEAASFDGSKGAGARMNGELDEVKIYERALSQNDAALHHNPSPGYYNTHILDPGNDPSWDGATWNESLQSSTDIESRIHTTRDNDLTETAGEWAAGTHFPTGASDIRAYWGLESADGTAHDLAGNGHGAKVSGSVETASEGFVPQSNAYRFDGSGDYLQTQQNTTTTTVTVNASNDGWGSWTVNVSLWKTGVGNVNWKRTKILNNAESDTHWIESITMADMDQDGDNDIVYPIENSTDLYWAENNGDSGGWTRHSINNDDIESASVGDIDGDGDIDVIAGDNSDDIDFNQNTDGVGTSWSNSEIAGNVGGTVRSVALGDIDGDGDLDAIGTGYFNEVRWWENDGTDAGWTQHTLDTLPDYGWTVGVADLDSDGDLDAVSGDRDGSVLFHENDGTDSSWPTTQVHDFGSDNRFTVAIADFDNDGDLDIVSGADNGGEIFLHQNNDGDGASWSTTQIGSLSDEIRTIQAGDINHDGRMDIAVGADCCGGADQSAYFENNGSGQWPQTTFADEDDGIYGLSIGDIDSDGDLDIVWGEDEGDDIATTETEGVRLDKIGTRQITFDNAGGTAQDVTFTYSESRSDFRVTATVNRVREHTEVFQTNDEQSGDAGNRIVQKVAPGTNVKEGFDWTAGNRPDLHLEQMETDHAPASEVTLNPGSDWYEVGRFTTTDAAWKTIEFENTYEHPVIVGSPNTYNEPEDQLVFEATDVTRTAAKVRLCENEGGNSDDCDTHAEETGSYLVVDAAASDEKQGLKAGTFTSANANVRTVTFDESFSSVPVVIGATQTSNAKSPVITQIDNGNQVTTGGFDMYACQQNGPDGCNSSAREETIGWVAVEPGNLPFPTADAEANTTDTLENDWRKDAFSTSFSEKPVGFAHLIDHDGSQEALHAGAKNITTDEIWTRWTELNDGDTTDSHSNNAYGWLAVQPEDRTADKLTMSAWVNVEDLAGSGEHFIMSRLDGGGGPQTAAATTYATAGQGDWNDGTFTHTTSDRDDNSGNLGIGTHNGSTGENLQAYWRMDTTSGSIKDYSGNSFNPANNGADRGAEGVAGTNGFSFDGDKYLEQSHDTALEPERDNFTVLAWVKAQGVGSGGDTNWATIVDKYRNSDEEAYQFHVYEDAGADDGILRAEVGDGYNSYDIWGPTSYNLLDDTWHLVGLRIDNLRDRTDLIIDGNIVRSKKTPFNHSISESNNPLFIGGEGSGETLDGNLDEITIYDRYLTNDEIQDHYLRTRDTVEDFENGVLQGYGGDTGAFTVATSPTYGQDTDLSRAEGKERVDDYEDSDISEYTYNTSYFQVQSEVVKKGSNALRADQNAGTEEIFSYNGLNAYPRAGDNFTYYHRTEDTSGSRSIFYFGKQNEGPEGGGGASYEIEHDYSGDTINLQLDQTSGDAVANDITLASGSITWSADTWYEIHVQWQNNGFINITLYDDTGTELQTISDRNDTFVRGGIGFNGDDNHAYFDNITITGGHYQGPIHQWDFEREDPNTVYDTVQDQDGILGGAEQHTKGCQGGDCLEYQDDNDWVNVTHSSSHNPRAGLTVSGWIKPYGDTGDYQTIVGHDYDNVFWMGLNNADNNDPEYQIVTRDAGRTTRDSDAPNQVSFNSWNHLAMTYKASTGNWSRYLNGNFVGDSSLGGPISFEPGASLCIGNDLCDNSEINRVDGKLDEICMFDRAVTPSEMSTIYSDGCQAVGRPERETQSFGKYALQYQSTSDSTNEIMTDIDRNVSQGQTIQFWTYLDDSVETSFDFGAQNEQGASSYEGYDLLFSTGLTELWKRDSGSWTKLDDNTSISLPQEEWIKVQVVWNETGAIRGIFHDSDGSVIDTLQATDTTFTQGGIGWNAYQNSTDQYVDNLQVINNSSPDGNYTDQKIENDLQQVWDKINVDTSIPAQTDVDLVFRSLGTGGPDTVTTQSSGWWTAGNTPDLHLETINSSVKTGEPSTTDVHVRAANRGHGVWNVNVSLYNYSYTSIGDVDGDGENENIRVKNYTIGTAPNAGGDPAVEATPVGDIDQDGDPDTVSMQDGGQISWWENVNGDGSSWSRTIIQDNDTTSGGETVNIGDIDVDGDLDVVGGYDGGTVAWWENPGGDATGSWTRHIIGDTSAYNFRASTIGDFDMDGNIDVAVGDSQDQIEIWLNPGGDATGSWTSNTLSPDNDNSNALLTGDIDQDGNPDIISGENDGDVWRCLNGASWSCTNIHDAGGPAHDVYALAAGDIDQDGNPDLVAGDGEADIELLLNDGTSSWPNQTIGNHDGGSDTRAVVTADLDQDGDLDVMSGDKFDNGDIWWYENDGDYSSQWNAEDLTGDFVSATDGIYSINLADFDGDGVLELATGSYNTNDIFYWNMSGIASDHIGSQPVPFRNATGDTTTASIDWTPEKDSYDLLAQIDGEMQYTHVLESIDMGDGAGNRMVQSFTYSGNGYGEVDRQIIDLQDGTTNYSITAADSEDARWSINGSSTNTSRGWTVNDVTIYTGSEFRQATSSIPEWNDGDFVSTSAERDDRSGDLALGSTDKEQPGENPDWASEGSSGFTDITSGANLGSDLAGSCVGAGGGVILFPDLDQDGYLDIYLNTNENSCPFDNVRENDGDNTFTDRGSAIDTESGRGAGVGDYQNDGDTDIIMRDDYSDGNGPHMANNTGSWSFDHAAITGNDPNDEAVMFHDIDGDGDLDVWANEDAAYLWYEQDDGADTFTARNGFPDDSGGRTAGSLMAGNPEGNTAADIDNDGYPDFILWNRTHAKVLENDGDYTYTEVTDMDAVYGLPEDIGDHENNEWAWGDYDSDGDTDVFVSGESRDGTEVNGLYQNDGSGSFTDVTSSAGITLDSTGFDGAAWGDHDNDGHLDLLLQQCGNFEDSTETCSNNNSKLYQNDGDGTFTDVTTSVGLDTDDVGKTVGFFDSDNDGDLDIISNSPPTLWRNDEDDGNYLRIYVEGNTSKTGGAPKTPLGAQIYVYNQTGTMIAHRTVQTSQNQLQPPLRQHVGLDPKKEYNISVWFPQSSTWTNYTRVIPEHEVLNMSGAQLDNTIRVTETTNDATVRQSNPIGYWRLDTTSGDVKDYSGYGNTGTTVSFDGDERGSRGVFNTSAFRFDGQDDHVDVGGNHSLNPQQAITVSAWVRPDNMSDEGTVIAKGDQFDDNPAYGPYGIATPSSNDWMYWSVWNETDTRTMLARELNTDEWTHVVGTYSDANDNMSFYVNGTLVNSKTFSGAMKFEDRPVHIGAEPYWDEDYFNGSIDEVQIYDRELTPSEVRELYMNGRDGVYNGTYTRSIDTDSAKTWDEIAVTVDNLPAETGVSVEFRALGSSGSVVDTQTANLQEGTNNISLEVSNTEDAEWVITGNSTNVTKSWEIGSTNVYYSTSEGAQQGDAGYGMGVSSDGKLFTELHTKSSSNDFTVDAKTLNEGQWYHVASTYDGSSIRSYINGKKQAESTASGDIPDLTNPLVLGSHSETPGNAQITLEGRMDEAKIYGRALDATSIQDETDSFDYTSKWNDGEYNWLNWERKGGVTREQKQVAANNVDDLQPAHYWPLDEGSGNTAHDLVSNNDGSILGDPDWDSGCHSVNCLEFDGENTMQSINITTSTKLNSPSTTLSAWVYIYGDVNDYQTIFDKDYIEQYYMGLDDDDNTVGEWQLTTEGSGRVTEQNGSVNYNQWHHFAMTYDHRSGNWSRYIDGDLVGWTSMDGPIEATTNPLCIGDSKCHTESNSNEFNGKIDEPCIFADPMTDSQIQQLYNNGCGSFVETGEETMQARMAEYDLQNSNVLAHWGFEGDGQLVTDASGNSHHARLGNDTTDETTDPERTRGYSGDGVTFDGIDDKIKADVPHSDQITVSGWVWRDPGHADDQNPYSIVSKWNTDNSEKSWFMGVYDGNFSYRIDPIGSSTVHLDTDIPFRDAQWAHVAVTYDGDTLTGYYDGQKIAETSVEGGLNDPDEPVRIGKTGGGHHFQGQIDEVALLDTALTERQVSQLSTLTDFSTPVVQEKGDYSIAGARSQDQIHGVRGYNGTQERRDPAWLENCKYGGCLNFTDADNTTVKVTEGQALETSGLTATAWVYARTFSDDNNRNNIVSEDDEWVLSTRTTGELTGGVTGELCGNTTYCDSWQDTGHILNTGQWYHVAMTWNTTHLTYYVNGSQVGQTNPTDGPIKDNNAHKMGIGGRYPDYSDDPNYDQQFWDGRIDEVCVFGRSLNSSEISTAYTSNCDGGGLMPELHFRMDKGTGQQVPDTGGMSDPHTQFRVNSSISDTSTPPRVEKAWLADARAFSNWDTDPTASTFGVPIDDFEDGDINEYENETSGWTATTSTIKAGNYALKYSQSNGYTQYMYSYKRIKQYPEEGDSFQYWFRPTNASDGSYLFFFGKQDDGSFNNQYEIEHRPADSNVGFRLQVDDSGTDSTIDNAALNYTDNTWYRVEVDWRNDYITATLSNSSGHLATISGQDSTFEEGGIGFFGSSNDGLQPAYFDLVSFPVDEEERPESFEDQDIGEYMGDTVDFNLTDQQATTGRYSLAFDSSDDNSYLTSYSGLENYPGMGDRFSYQTRFGTGNQYWTAFSFASQSGGGIDHKEYEIEVRRDSNEVQLDWQGGGTDTTLAVDSSPTFNANEWYTVVTDWKRNGTIFINVYDEQDNNIASLSDTNHTWTRGGIGWNVRGNSTTTGYFDNLTMLDTSNQGQLQTNISSSQPGNSPTLGSISLFCLPPETGDWILTQDCVLKDVNTLPADLEVRNDATLTLREGATLQADLQHQALRVIQGAKILIEKGASIS